MYVWGGAGMGFTVIAHAQSVERARFLALEQIGETDGSTPYILEARNLVKTHTPIIWYYENAEFLLSESLQLEEADIENERLRKLLKPCDYGGNHRLIDCTCDPHAVM